MTKRLPPVHPGEILTEEFLKPMALTPYAVAKAIGVPRTRIERLARQKTALTADTALRLARFFGVTPAFWMGVQTQFDLEQAEDSAARELAQITPWSGNSPQWLKSKNPAFVRVID
jgi:antitoxin HigA-1